MCSEPLQGRRTTYTECCCLYGIAWSGHCAFCPGRDSGERLGAHNILCNDSILRMNKYAVTLTIIKPCVAVLRGLRNNVQPASEGRLRQPARAARI